MVHRARVLARVVLLAVSLAVLGVGATAYGALGPVPATNAILETTAQSPLDVLPRPSPAAVRSGPVTTSRTWSSVPLAAVLLLAGIGVAALVIRRRGATG
jgi:hypothetical protein